MAEKTKVPFTKDNVMKCICTQCPVQANSSCVAGKKKVMKESMGKQPLVAEDIPGLYCSSGVASCKDIDTSKMCMCMACPLWEEFSLGSGQPMGYYCRDGRAG